MKTFVLFLPGVTAKDYISEKLEDEVNLEEFDNETEVLEFDSEDSSSDIDIDMNIANIIDNRARTTTTYDEIPKYFVNKKSWIKKTNLQCWMCCNPITGMPWTIPVAWSNIVKPGKENKQKLSKKPPKIDSMSTEIKVMEVRSVQCSEFCAIRYIRRVKDDEIPDQWESEKLLLILYRKLTGKSVASIPEALDKSKMEQFCGSEKGLSVVEFKNSNKKLK